MQNFSVSLRAMLASLVRHRGLVWTMVRREVAGRYRGSVMGLLWSLFNPIFMLTVYTFVFSVVFKARWNVGSDSRTEFALMLFAGLMVFSLFSECLSRAPGLVVGNSNYVKKVIFPLDILPWVALGSAFFHFAVSLAVWLIAFVFIFGWPPLTILLLPLVLLPLVLLTLGLSWLLASLGVFLRDVGQVVAVLIPVLMFMSPIFYPMSALPENFQAYLLLNPLTLIIEQARGVMYLGQLPELRPLAVHGAVSLLIFWLGFAWFQKTRKGFADVL